MTRPPTNADLPAARGRLFSTLWKKYVPIPGSFLPWLCLVRLPNLLTIPGDVLAGYLLAPAVPEAGVSRLLLAIAAGILFYAAGLILNDLFDFTEDLRERPTRPLPAEKIQRETAIAATLIFLWVAVFFAAFVDALPIALPLVLCMFGYNAGLKRNRYLGPALMGACRAGNLLLGTAAATEGLGLAPAPIAAALALGLYVGTITHLARNETQPGATFTPPRIGTLLGLLIPLQALFCTLAVHRFPANLLGLALLPFLPLHRRLAARFPPS